MGSVQQNARSFIARVRRHQLTLEGLGEDGLVKVIDQPAGAGGRGREVVNPCKSDSDASDYLSLLSEAWKRNSDTIESALCQLWLSTPGNVGNKVYHVDEPTKPLVRRVEPGF